MSLVVRGVGSCGLISRGERSHVRTSLCALNATFRVFGLAASLGAYAKGGKSRLVRRGRGPSLRGGVCMTQVR